MPVFANSIKSSIFPVSMDWLSCSFEPSMQLSINLLVALFLSSIIILPSLSGSKLLLKICLRLLRYAGDATNISCISIMLIYDILCVLAGFATSPISILFSDRRKDVSSDDCVKILTIVCGFSFMNLFKYGSSIYLQSVLLVPTVIFPILNCFILAR